MSAVITAIENHVPEPEDGFNLAAWVESIFKYVSETCYKNTWLGGVGLYRLGFALLHLAFFVFIYTVMDTKNNYSLYKFYCIGFWIISLVLIVFFTNPYDESAIEYAKN
jgi:hypothetical protein